MTNNLNGGDLQIVKCDKCRDGYLIVREANNGTFLGCTNYKDDRTGCDRMMSREYYRRYINGEGTINS